MSPLSRDFTSLERRVFVPEPIVNNSFATVFPTAHLSQVAREEIGQIRRRSPREVA